MQNITSSKDIWDSMKKKFQGSAKAKKTQLQALRADFETLQMKSGESISDYLSRTMAIANKLRIYGEQIDDSIIVGKVPRSLTSSTSILFVQLWSQTILMISKVR